MSVPGAGLVCEALPWFSSSRTAGPAPPSSSHDLAAELNPHKTELNPHEAVRGRRPRPSRSSGLRALKPGPAARQLARAGAYAT